MQIEKANDTKILVADDNLTSLLFLTSILREYGHYEVIECQNSTKVCELARQERPQLIFLDVYMPNMDGFEVCRQLKNDPDLNKIPVIFLTGSAEDLRQRIKGFDAGGVDYLIKPIESEELLARVESHLEIHRMRNMLEAIVDLQSRNIQEYNEAYNQINHFLTLSRETHDQIMSNLEEGVFCLNEAGVCIEINDTAARLFKHIPTENLIGKNIPKLYINTHKETFPPHDWKEKIHQNKNASWKGIWRRSNGETFSVEYRIREVSKENEHTLINVIFTDVTNLRLVENKIKKLAQQDSLTGLLNRSGLIHSIQDSVRQQKVEHKNFAVLMIDLDDFKWINDTCGHIMGDLALTTIGQRIKGCLEPDDIAGRLGGDEFMVILNNVNNRLEALSKAENIKAWINKTIKADGTEVNINVSIGMAIYMHADGVVNSHSIVLEQTDFSMYQAKAYKKGSISIFGDEMRRNLETEKALSNDLNHVIERGELRIALQPQYSINNNKYYGAEVLARWKHPYKGLLNASEFIPIAEKMGIIRELSDWVFDHAISHVESWLKQGYYTGNIAINLSAKQIAIQGFEDSLLAKLEKKGINPKLITLELTETMLIQVNKNSKQALKKLSDAGIKIALDDFGTGYSSLTLLNQIDIDILKLDSEFVEGIPNNKKSVEIVKALIKLADTLGLNVIAEKIEHDYQVENLRLYGCNIGQGYYYSKPMTVQDFENLIKSYSVDLSKDELLFQNGN